MRNKFEFNLVYCFKQREKQEHILLWKQLEIWLLDCIFHNACVSLDLKHCQLWGIYISLHWHKNIKHVKIKIFLNKLKDTVAMRFESSQIPVVL